MKKLTFWLLTLCLVMVLAGCADSDATLISPFTCYYPLQEYSFGIHDQILASQQLEGAGHDGDFSWLIGAYLQSAPPEKASTFPKELNLVNWTIDDETLTLTFTDPLAFLHGVRLTTTCAAIARTCSQLIPCRYVVFTTESALLNGENELTIDTETTLFLDDLAPETTE